MVLEKKKYNELNEQLTQLTIDLASCSNIEELNKTINILIDGMTLSELGNSIKKNPSNVQKNKLTALFVSFSNVLNRQMDRFKNTSHNRDKLVVDSISNYNEILKNLSEELQQQLEMQGEQRAENTPENNANSDKQKILKIKRLKELNKTDGIINQISQILEKGTTFKSYAEAQNEDQKYKKTGHEGQYTMAHKAARDLGRILMDLSLKYAALEIDNKEFIQRAKFVLDSKSVDADKLSFPADIKEQLTKAREYVAQLNKHRGPKQILVNLLAACLSLVVPYFITASIKNRLLIFRPGTNTGKKVTTLLNTIEEIDGSLSVK